ncbi:hypothetical protein [Mycolicibacterium frederiksbergense]|nr:hypothetical protein [Mycolicibacterium frederiksbergense]MDO0976945.1 hypothetical protein [Mycolicibacterium frederiksbergense]
MIMIGLFMLALVGAILALQICIVVGVVVCQSIGAIWRAIR